MPYNNIEKADEADLIALADDRGIEVNGGGISAIASAVTTASISVLSPSTITIP